MRFFLLYSDFAPFSTANRLYFVKGRARLEKKRSGGSLQPSLRPERLSLPAIEFRVEGVEVFGVELVGRQAEALAEALEVNNLPLAQEANRVRYVRVVAVAQNVVVRRARLLLCRICCRTT